MGILDYMGLCTSAYLGILAFTGVATLSLYETLLIYQNMLGLMVFVVLAHSLILQGVLIVC